MPVDGGVYFHPDLMESSKSIYKEHWIIIIHAFSIWMKNSNETIETDQENEGENETKRTDKENDFVFTVLGKSMLKQSSSFV